MALLTFRNSKIVYYGPHPCETCGIDIAKMAHEWGGTAFTYPDRPIYPNTEWHPHVCDPFEVRRKLAREAMQRVRAEWTDAHPYKVRDEFVIVATPVCLGSTVISPHCTFYSTEGDAWVGADERARNGWPTWTLDKCPAVAT